MSLCSCEGFTSPEVVQVSNNTLSPGSTPRRRSAAPDMALTARRKLSASKEPKVSIEALNELNKRNKTASDSSLVSALGRDIAVRDTPQATTESESNAPTAEISSPSNKFTMVSDRTTQRSPSPLTQEKRAYSMSRQEAVSNIKRSRALLNGEAKVNGDDKVMTTAKPPLVATKEPAVTSKPPTPKHHHDSSRPNNIKNSRDEHPAVADIKDATKEQSSITAPSRRISQYRLTGSEALHIFHPTRRNTSTKLGDYGDASSEHLDDSRSNSPAPPSKSPVPEKRISNRDSNLAVKITEEPPVQQEPPAPPKSPGTSVTGTRRPVVTEKMLAHSGKDEETVTQQEPPPPPKSPGASVTGARRPGVVESKQKKMLALMGKEASVDSERPTEILRTTPVSINSI